MGKQVENILLNFQKNYTGKTKSGEMPYFEFDAINEHKSDNNEIIWGQFTSGNKRKIASSSKVKELSKNKGYAFFISDEKKGGVRLFYGRILNVYERFDSETKINEELVPSYYKEQIFIQKGSREESQYEFEVGLWLKLEFFKELDLSVLDYITSVSNENNSIAETRRRRPIHMSYVDISSKINISSFESVSSMRRTVLEYGSIIPPLWSKDRLIGMKEVRKSPSEEKNVISLFNEKSLNLFEDFFTGREPEYNFDIQKDYKPFIYEFVTEENISEFENSDTIEIYSKLDIESSNFNIAREELIEGQIIFCASPETNVKAFVRVSPSKSSKRINKLRNQLKGYLLTTEYIMTNYPERININNQKDAKKYIEENIKIDSELSQVKIDIHSVGNGNFIKMKLNDRNSNESIVYFDVGHGKGSNIPNNLSNNIDAIFLSHWDTDHINGALEILDNNKHVMWFAPKLNKQSGTVFYNLLVCYLLVRNRLKMFSVGFNNKCIYKANGISLFKGSGKGGASKVDNSLGLIFELECGEQNILLPGDCEYKYLPQKIINKQYNYLVVPHHGSNSIKDKKKFKVPIVSKKITTNNYKINAGYYQITPRTGTAIISCSVNRADKYHIEYLKNNSFHVVETNEDVTGISIELH